MTVDPTLLEIKKRIQDHEQIRKSYNQSANQSVKGSRRPSMLKNGVEQQS